MQGYNHIIHRIKLKIDILKLKGDNRMKDLKDVETFVAYVDISGFKETMKKKERHIRH